MKKIISLISILLISISMLGCINKKLYGNTTEQILKSLGSLNQLKEIGTDNIYFIDSLYINDSKIVGFTSYDYNGIAVYEKDSNNNYIFSSLDTLSNNSNLGLTLLMDNRDIYSICTHGYVGFFVFSYDLRVSRIEITINDKYVLSSDLSTTERSLTLISDNIPVDEAKSMSLKYKYYDLDNNEIILD